MDAVLPFLENQTELLTIVLAAIGGGLALWRYWRDQSWQKKQFAYNYAEDVFRDSRTMTALRMLDWSRGKIPADIADQYGLDADKRIWTAAEVGEALRAHDPALRIDDPARGQAEGSAEESRQAEGEEAADVTQGEAKAGRFSRKEYLIRELFDDCLARFERLGHFMKSRVISKNDFPTTLAYYPAIMKEPRLEPIKGPLCAYMKRYGFDYALYVFDSFDETKRRSFWRRVARLKGPSSEAS